MIVNGEEVEEEVETFLEEEEEIEDFSEEEVAT